MWILMLELAGGAIISAIVCLTLYLSGRTYQRQALPESVYERAINWHKEIMIMKRSDPDECFKQYYQWMEFMNKIPREKNNGFKLI